jgi:DNA mismatch endonuclease Vsr
VADVFSKKKRSQVMAAIRSRGNKATELKLAAVLRAAGITGWRRNQPLPGRPDFVFRHARLAVFVDGCFWHGCRWHCRMPKSRGGYWGPKISRNRARDKAVSALLRRAGWRVHRIWEHSLRSQAALSRLQAILANAPKTEYKPTLRTEDFEKVLSELCNRMAAECRAGKTYSQSKPFENRVREVIRDLLKQFKIPVDFSPHPFGFPDIVLGEFGIEVKLTVNDTWRSVANSVFESFRSKNVKHIYVVFGKMGGEPGVRWGHYEECVMHVRTSHVPRFEVDIDAKESLFRKFGISYEEFSNLPEEDRMEHVRKYARSRLKRGERLWWLEEKADEGHSLPVQVQLFSNLTNAEKLKMRGEASLLCPQIVGSSRNRTKYTDPIMYLLTYRGVLATRDAFSAGSAAGPERGGIYVQKALRRVQQQMIEAASYLEPKLFVEYWGRNVPPERRIKEWLKMADVYAKVADRPWKPSEVLFEGLV